MTSTSLTNNQISAINAAHASATAAMSSAVGHAIECGKLLAEAKAAVPYGQWADWLAEHCPTISERTDRLYRRLYDHRDRINSSTEPIRCLADAIRLVTESDPDRQCVAEVVPLSTEEEDELVERELAACEAMIEEGRAAWANMAKLLDAASENVRKKHLQELAMQLGYDSDELLEMLEWGRGGCLA